MFVSLGIDLSNTNTSEGLERIQKVVTTLQKCVYANEGSLNKLLMDDKGSTLICIWGLPPLAHEDDAVRAVLCSLQIRKQLAAPELSCLCNIGISTGVVFAGVVGTAGSRREYSVIGDVVNLAARIMAYPKYNKEPMGKIYVDQKTKEDASQKIRFTYKTHSAFKGKAFKLPIFEPIDPDVEFSKLENVSIERLLLVHSNPFVLDRNSTYQYGKIEMFGKEKIKEAIMNSFENFAMVLEESRIAIIEGMAGSGKTLLARHIADEIIKKDVEGRYQTWKENGRIEIFVSQLNPSLEKRCFNGLRLILNAISLSMAKYQKIDRGEMMEQIIKESKANISDKLFLIEDLFSIKLPHGFNQSTQYKLPDDPIRFVKKEEYPENVTEEITAFIIEVFKIRLAEQLNDSSFNESGLTGRKKSLKQTLAPIVIFFDDAQKMDKESWKTIDELQENIRKLMIFIIVRQNTEKELDFPSKEIQDYVNLLDKEDIINAHYALDGLQLPYFNVLVAIFGDIYYTQMEEEIKSMLQNDDMAVLDQLRDLNFLKDPVKQIDPSALNAILKKTEGNPQLTFQFALSLMKSKYLKNIGGTLTMTAEFIKAKDFDDWAYVEVPDLALRYNSMLIDKLTKTTTG